MSKTAVSVCIMLVLILLVPVLLFVAICFWPSKISLPDQLIGIIGAVLWVCGVFGYFYSLTVLYRCYRRVRGLDDHDTDDYDANPIATSPPIHCRDLPVPLPQSLVCYSQPVHVPVPNSQSAVPQPQPHLSPVEAELPNQNQMVCAICLTKEKDLAFGCGHMSCRDCGSNLSNCHICRQRITIYLKLFPG